jgi:hypothetical protein
LLGLDSILKQNPDLAKHQGSSKSTYVSSEQQGAGNLFAGLGGMFSSFFGGGQKALNNNPGNFMNQPPVYVPVQLTNKNLINFSHNKELI